MSGRWNVQDDVVARIAHAHDNFGIADRLFSAMRNRFERLLECLRLVHGVAPVAILAENLKRLLVPDENNSFPHKSPC